MRFPLVQNQTADFTCFQCVTMSSRREKWLRSSLFWFPMFSYTYAHIHIRKLDVGFVLRFPGLFRIGQSICCSCSTMQGEIAAVQWKNSKHDSTNSYKLCSWFRCFPHFSIGSMNSTHRSLINKHARLLKKTRVKKLFNSIFHSLTIEMVELYWNKTTVQRDKKIIWSRLNVVPTWWSAPLEMCVIWR